MSAKVTDGWSLRALQKLLRVGPARLRYLIGHGLLRVRDAHITAASLAAFCEKNGENWEPSILATVTTALREDDAGRRLHGFTFAVTTQLPSEVTP